MRSTFTHTPIELEEPYPRRNNLFQEIPFVTRTFFDFPLFWDKKKAKKWNSALAAVIAESDQN